MSEEYSTLRKIVTSAAVVGGIAATALFAKDDFPVTGEEKLNYDLEACVYDVPMASQLTGPNRLARWFMRSSNDNNPVEYGDRVVLPIAKERGEYKGVRLADIAAEGVEAMRDSADYDPGNVPYCSDLVRFE